MVMSRFRGGLCWVCTHILVLSLIACQAEQSNRLPAAELKFSPEIKSVHAIAWLPTGYVINDDRERLWYFDNADGQWAQLSLEKDSQCSAIRYNRLSVLPDGRLGINQDCNGYWPERSGWRVNTIESILAYDISLKHTDTLAYDVPKCVETSWHHTFERGICDTVGSFSTLYWLTSTMVTPVDLTLSDGEKAWYLPDSVQAEEQYDPYLDRDEPILVGDVGSPTWSPNDTQIAFWATLEPIGRPLEIFQEHNWNLYIVEVATMQVKTLLVDMWQPRRLRWSPDGEHLAFIQPLKSGNSDRLKLLSLKTLEVTEVADGHFEDMVWSPDGSQLLTKLCVDDVCKETELWIYDVNELLQAH